jgi:TrkA domain protein
VDVERVPLPGIGLRHVLTTGRGRRVGVVSHHNGRHELVLYRRDDPDSAADSVALSPEEANVLAELLGTGRVVERLAELHRQVDGLVSLQVPIPSGSAYDGRPLADTRARTRTGASIVAVVRDRDVVASPRPDFVFAAGDIVVVIGTAEGAAAVAEILGERRPGGG